MSVRDKLFDIAHALNGHSLRHGGESITVNDLSVVVVGLAYDAKLRRQFREALAELVETLEPKKGSGR